MKKPVSCPPHSNISPRGRMAPCTHGLDGLAQDARSSQRPQDNPFRSALPPRPRSGSQPGGPGPDRPPGKEALLLEVGPDHLCSFLGEAAGGAFPPPWMTPGEPWGCVRSGGQAGAGWQPVNKIANWRLRGYFKSVISALADMA